MRRIEREHIERRVTCTNCPNRYCLDCVTDGCPACGCKDFYSSHTKQGTFSENDIWSSHDNIGEETTENGFERIGRVIERAEERRIEDIPPFLGYTGPAEPNPMPDSLLVSRDLYNEANRIANSELDTRVRMRPDIDESILSSTPTLASVSPRLERAIRRLNNSTSA